MPNLAVKIFSNPANANFDSNTQLADWTEVVQGLQFSTSAFGGFQSCSFLLKRGFDALWRILEGKSGQPTYVTNRLRIEDPSQNPGVRVPWEGLIATIELQYGQQVKSRTYRTLYNAVRVQHFKTTGKKKTYTVKTNAASQNKFGIRVYATDTQLRGNKNSTQPVAMATRFLQQHKNPPRASGTEFGGVEGDVYARVTAMGWADTLRWRFAYNTKGAAAVDTGQTVQDLLAATAVRGWQEPEVGNWGQQFIEANFNRVQTSGITVAPKNVQGRTRLDIISELCRYGSADGRRMLFQVFQGQSSAKGGCWFTPQFNDLPFTSDYRCYYFSSVQNKVFNRNDARIPLWAVRAGNWIVDKDSLLTPPRTAQDIFDDPRAIWIEETQYDVDNDRLKIMTTDQSSSEIYLARVIEGASLATD